MRKIAAVLLLIAATAAPSVVNADGMEMKHRYHIGRGCGFGGRFYRDGEFLHAHMPLRVMHDANLPPWALGDSASHLRARLRLLAVLLTPDGLKPPARWALKGANDASWNRTVPHHLMRKRSFAD